ncbi:MAG: hypothetical protein VZR56_04585 [Treponema sp.]|nr:hypothetical protein [Treponema sp.]
MKRFTALVLMFAAFIPCMADERAKPVVLAQEWHNGDSESVEFSPDGKFILTDSTSDSRLWDVETGLLVSVFPKASVAPSVSAGEEKNLRVNSLSEREFTAMTFLLTVFMSPLFSEDAKTEFRFIPQSQGSLKNLYH